MNSFMIQLQNYRFLLKNLEPQFDTINMNNYGIQSSNIGMQILNIGIQMLYSTMQMHIYEIDYLNLKQQIQNITTQIQNIELEINNNINMKMNQMNNIPMQINHMNQIILNQNNNFLGNINNNPQIRIDFKTTQGERIHMNFDYGITVKDMLKRFLKRIEKEELFCSDKIVFLYNATKLNWYDCTPIEKKFDSINNSIIVNDNTYLIGG